VSFCHHFRPSSVRRPLTLSSFTSFGLAVSDEKMFWKLTNQKQELPVVVMFVNVSEQN
jgi:hypothetical protein